MKFKKLVLTTGMLLLFFSLWAKDAYYENDDYKLSLSYNDTVLQGDAVFLRLTITPQRLWKKPGKTLETTASVNLLYKKEKIDGSAFFRIHSKKTAKNAVELLSGIPVSTNSKEGSYSLQVLYTPFGTGTMEFSVPLTIKKKDFQAETIPLDDENAALKSDMSSERLDQIEKLNNVLRTTGTAVYQFFPFTEPVTSDRRTAGFGDRRIYTYANGRSSADIHRGIDFGVPTGTPVHACAAGKVVMAGKRLTTGWTVVLEHLPGLYSLYYHMDSLSVKPGTVVKQGDQLGLSGATGLATGPHLHWEIRLNTSAVNPDFFTGDFAFAKQDEQ
jgi:murein DD-endopeptidase MepM/ murein hydrolase activator NlpD